MNEIIDTKKRLKFILKEVPLIEDQLLIDNIMDLEILKEYYVRENKRDIAIKFDNLKRNLLKF